MNGRHREVVDTKAIDVLNRSYTKFMKEVYDSLSDARFKIRKEDIIPENIQIDWLWLSSVKE